MGKKTVAVYAEEASCRCTALRQDEASRIGEGMGPSRAYLGIERIIRVAKDCGAGRDPPRVIGLAVETRCSFCACHANGHYHYRPKAENQRQLGGQRPGARQSSRSTLGVPVIPHARCWAMIWSDQKTSGRGRLSPLMLKAFLGRRRRVDAGDQL